MKKRTIVLALILFIILFTGYFAWKAYKTSQKPHYAVRMNTVLAKETTITLSENGFSPKEVTIKVGTAIRWKNDTKDKQTVNSDNYPTNQLHKELNFGIFNPGSTVMYIFTKPGTYGYHNQFHPEQKGTITVVK